ncbi:Uncharacterised protein [Moraxella equi]|uniref:Uncharacterized protein n=1 Tax=Moraxella equi TaxID=60442 RepID=A0A378QQB9_9GAMM|nr:Uncharacterised protein [Moraxella equi]
MQSRIANFKFFVFINQFLILKERNRYEKVNVIRFNKYGFMF